MRSRTFRASSLRRPTRGSGRSRRGIALSRRSRPPRIPFCTGCIETLPYEISSPIVAIVRLPRNTLRPRFAVNPRPEATFASSISYHRENTIQEKCCSGKMPFRINGIPIVFAAMPGTPAGEKGLRRPLRTIRTDRCGEGRARPSGPRTSPRGIFPSAGGSSRAGSE